MTPFTLKIVAISDVHTKWNKLVIPECDILISAGDYSFHGEQGIVRSFHKWLSAQPARHVISVQGNHETWVEENFDYAKKLVSEVAPRVHFIDTGLVEIEGVKIFGSAVTPRFFDWAWNVDRGEPIKRHWEKIPDDTQILVTHGPRHGILDKTLRGENVGCEDLGRRIDQLKDLKLHISGHIHPGSGEKLFNGVYYINASICDERYQPTNPVRKIDLEL